jgi:hypothetical protein
MAMMKGVAAAVAVLAGGLWLAGAPARAESVMKQCGAEWKAAKAANTTNNQTWPQFLTDCRARHGSGSAAAPAAAPAPAPTTAAAPNPAPAPAAKPAAAAAPTGAGEFASEGEAKGRCPSDTVVWVNNKSKVYHYSGDRYFGTTKHGAYMCEADAKSAGDSASKTKIKPKG